MTRPVVDLSRQILDDGDRLRLVAVLAQARELGFLGPTATPEQQVAHAEGLASTLVWALSTSGVPRGPVVDLGSGAGIPGLVVAMLAPDQPLLLLDAHSRRTTWVREAAVELGLPNVSVVTGRAEILGRVADLREKASAVVARGFGPPATTAECATGFVMVGGVVVVSEPQSGSDERWPPNDLSRLSLTVESLIRCEPSTAVVIRKSSAVSDVFPRRDGVPRKRPLF